MSPRCSAIQLNVALKAGVMRMEVNLSTRLDPLLFDFLYGPRTGSNEVCNICFDFPQQVIFCDCSRSHPTCHNCARYLGKKCPVCLKAIGTMRHLPPCEHGEYLH